MANVFAAIQAHKFAVGAAVGGVAPTGTDSEETLLRGLYRKWDACTDGGLFTFWSAPTVHASHSGCLRQIAWNLDGMTDIKFSWLDAAGWEVVFAEPTVDIGLLDLQQVMLVLPRGAIRVVATGVTKANAGIVTWWEKGLADDALAHLPVLGSFALP